MKVYGRVLVLLLMVWAASGCTIATVRSLHEDQEAKAGFNPDNYVASIWDSQFMPAMTVGAVEINDLLAALDENQAQATELYGKRTSNGPFSFMTRGEARITAIDRSSRVGLAGMDLEPFDGQADVFLAIGPVLRGNALRDAIGFIAFNDFTNQVEFASVSTALKNHIAATVLEPVDVDALAGQTVRFMGAFTLENRNEIVIMPVTLERVD